jgi:hypothetical protein
MSIMLDTLTELRRDELHALAQLGGQMIRFPRRGDLERLGV